jgi:hypothetical protein
MPSAISAGAPGWGFALSSSSRTLAADHQLGQLLARRLGGLRSATISPWRMT